MRKKNHRINMQPSKKVIILGCKDGGLAIARSLSKRGLYVIGVTHSKTDVGLMSRYLNETSICPNPKNQQAFIDFLLHRTDTWSGALILETNDSYMIALSHHKAELSEYYRLVTPDLENAKTFIEKDKTYSLADKVNVLHPKILKPKNLKDLDAIEDQIFLPIMIKPIFSHPFQAIFREKLFICESFEELRFNFKRTVEANQPVLISEVIPGTDYATMEKVQLYINTKGDFSAELFNIKLRQHPPMYGSTRVGRTTPINQEVLEQSRRLLKHINFKGYASVEFKRDYRDNQLKLMEVNIRMIKGLNLAIASGVDFPWIIYQDLVMDRQMQINKYHEKTYLIDIIPDVMNYLRVDRSKNIIRFLGPYFKRKTFHIFNRNDLKPFLKQCQNHSRFLKNILSVFKKP